MDCVPLRYLARPLRGTYRLHLQQRALLERGALVGEPTGAVPAPGTGYPLDVSDVVWGNATSDRVTWDKAQ